MHSSTDNTLFNVQHKHKCYCQNRNLCYCTGIENTSRKSSGQSYKFIKVRSDQGGTKQSKSSSLCSISSFSPAPTLASMSSMTTATESKLTGRRELYERSKLERGDFNNKFNVLTWNVQEHILFHGVEHSGLFSDERIAKLQEFRLQNPQECLSSCKRFQIDKTKNTGGTSKEPITEETTKYTFSNRGLLKKIGSYEDSRAAVVTSKAAINDILRQKLNSSNNKNKLIKKATYLPENSLALRHQKTY